MTAVIKYSGELRNLATHVKSGITILTDAPVDNHGKGEAFSPTDLVAASLGSCMLTVMGIVAQKNAINLEGMEASVEKIMATDPRRVSELRVRIIFPKGMELEDKQKQLLEHAALNCPVAYSLHPDLRQDVEFIYH